MLTGFVARIRAVAGLAESFFGGQESELSNDAEIATRAEARTALFEYIEVFHNRQRLHSSLG